MSTGRDWAALSLTTRGNLAALSSVGRSTHPLPINLCVVIKLIPSQNDVKERPESLGYFLDSMQRA